MSMYLYVCGGLLSLVLISLLRRFQALKRQIAIAETTGLPYVVLPFYRNSRVWMLWHGLLLPALEKIPGVKDWQTIKLLWTFHAWRFRRDPFDRIGDTILLVSPYNFQLATTDAEVTAQLTARKVDFPKPVDEYQIIKILGENIVTQEGADWRRHRKIVGPSFSEKSNALVFEESVRQTLSMLEVWSTSDGNTRDQMFVKDTGPSFAVLALHIICGAGFGVPQTWPGQGEAVLGDKVVPGFNTQRLINNHKLTFKHSLEDVIGVGFIWFAILGAYLLERSPFKVHKTLWQSFDELRNYFSELVEWKKKQLASGERDTATMDLLAPLIKASENGPGMTNGKSDEKTLDQSGALSKEEIIGNAFIFMFAGHETSANTLNYCNLYLATNREAQAHLQKDLDRIVGSKPCTEWTYASEMRSLYNSMVGAVQMEVLRLTPPVINIPKRSSKAGSQTLNMDGKTVTVPPGTYIQLNTIGTGRNPKYYPHSPSKITNNPTDLDDFVPERWLVAHKKSGEFKGEADGLETASFEAEGSLFRPERGAFIPFSEGARACPGRRFAQVEITAVVAVIFQSFSVELDCREWASDEQVRRMSLPERQIIYEKAKVRTRKFIDDSGYFVTLKIAPGKTPVRYMRRGQELFAGC